LLLLLLRGVWLTLWLLLLSMRLNSFSTPCFHPGIFPNPFPCLVSLLLLLLSWLRRHLLLLLLLLLRQDLLIPLPLWELPRR
jgi:hypothetical protein